ncbi:MAG: hypothetical protein J6N95_01075 [Bacilli bacterium]|nr:hypothetical protein [Bacilli bacterium]
MTPIREKFNFYFVGETIEDEIFYHEPDHPMSKLHAELAAKKLLRELGGGHLDAFNSDTDEFVFDVEI